MYVVYQAIIFEYKNSDDMFLRNTNVYEVVEQGGIAAWGQIYMGTPIGVVEIHLRTKFPPL